MLFKYLYNSLSACFGISKQNSVLFFLIFAGVIVFAINKRYKFGRYVIYIATSFTALSTLVIIMKALNPNTLQEFFVNTSADDLSKIFYFSLLILLVDITINVMIFYYTYKHKNYFIN